MVYCRCWQLGARIRDLGLIQENVGDGGLSQSRPWATSLTANSDDFFSTVLEHKARPSTAETVAREPQRWHKKTPFACRFFLYQPKNGGSSYIEKAPS